MSREGDGAPPWATLHRPHILVLDDVVPKTAATLSYDPVERRGSFVSQEDGRPVGPSITSHVDAQNMERGRGHTVTDRQADALLAAPTVSHTNRVWEVKSSTSSAPFARILYLPVSEVGSQACINAALDHTTQAIRRSATVDEKAGGCYAVSHQEPPHRKCSPCDWPAW